MTGWIGISIGDVTGIGPEVTLKALAAEAAADDARYLLIGDQAWLDQQNTALGLDLPLEPFTNYQADGRFFVFDPCKTPLPDTLTAGSPSAAEASLAWVTEGANRCLRGELDALITAPVNKESILRSGQPFIGQTEWLSKLAGTERTAMMLLGEDDRGRWLRVALATTHVPIKLVADQIRADKIILAIELAAEACALLGLARRRVAVCGLNPHAGEGGELGTEEIDIIAPAIEQARAQGLDVSGPHAADTLFHHAYRGDYEAVVAMYHDQGLVPLKMIGFETGVNWTLGLPFVRTSPDHGTAYNIAGQGIASPSSMQSAVRLAKKIARERAERQR